MELDISGCRSNFLFSSSFHLYPPFFCRAKPNDVPCDKGWLTTSHQHFEGAQTRTCARPHIHTTRARSHIVAGSWSLCQLCPPDLKEIWGADATLFCLTGLSEGNRSRQMRRRGGYGRHNRPSPPCRFVTQ